MLVEGYRLEIDAIQMNRLTNLRIVHPISKRQRMTMFVDSEEEGEGILKSMREVLWVGQWEVWSPVEVNWWWAAGRGLKPKAQRQEMR